MDSINAFISFHDLTTATAMLELWMEIVRARTRASGAIRRTRAGLTLR